jgi:serine/threonine protein kinase
MVSSELGACEWFVWDLRRSGLIDRGHLDQVVGEFLKRNPRAEPPALADFLVSQNVLSPFQAERILQGKTQGLVLGPYLLIDSIGSGSMGQVFKASSKTDSQLFAVKVLPRRSMWNVRLARRQVRAFSQFSHPAVVPFIDVGTSGGQHYLVWPLVQGEPLELKVQREGRIAPEVAAQIFTDVAQGLAIAHQNGLFHGLIKPSNIMVTPDSHGKLLDFGIGSLLVENENESLVDTMSTANTLTSGLDCSSPESIMEPTTRTPAGDQYSLGCVLYYAIAGRYPFPDGTAVEKMMAHQFKQPASLRDVAPNVPDALVSVVERLMQKSPEGRYSSTDELVEALQSFAHTAPVAPRPTSQSSHGSMRSNQAPATTRGSVHMPPKPVYAPTPTPQMAPPLSQLPIPPAPVQPGVPLPGYTGQGSAFPGFSAPPAPSPGSHYGAPVHTPTRTPIAPRGGLSAAGVGYAAEPMVAEPMMPSFPTAPVANQLPSLAPVTPTPAGRVQDLPSPTSKNWSEPTKTPVVGPFLIFLVAALVTAMVYLMGKNFLFPT